MPYNIYYPNFELLNAARQRLNENSTLTDFVSSIIQDSSLSSEEKLCILRNLGATRHLHHRPYLKTLTSQRFADAATAFELEQSYMDSMGIQSEHDRFDARNASVILLAGLGKHEKFEEAMDTCLEDAIRIVKKNGTHELDRYAPLNYPEYFFDKLCECLEATSFSDDAAVYRQKWKSFIEELAASSACSKKKQSPRVKRSRTVG